MIYLWIGTHIRYDMANFLANRIPAQDSHTVFNTRLAVSEGFANLYDDMASRVGLRVRIVHGYSKGYGYIYGQRFEKTTHAWNIVEINYQEYILDVTWSGLRKQKDESYYSNLHKLQMYFLADPQYLIYNHFPQDTDDQLLEEPWTKSEFEQSSLIGAFFSTLGLQYEQTKKGNFAADSVVRIRFYGRKLNKSEEDYRFFA